MTDNEIIKCLQEWSERGMTFCNIGMLEFARRVLALINRQKAEIERLEKENKILSRNADIAFQDGLNEAQDLYAEQIKAEIKSDAIKEFAERLKDRSKINIFDSVNSEGFVYESDIDNLVKEMMK